MSIFKIFIKWGDSPPKKVLRWVLSMNVKKNKAVSTSTPQTDSPLKERGIYSNKPKQSLIRETEKWKWSHSVLSDSFDPMDCSLSGSSVHGFFRARVLEWTAVSFSRRSSLPRNRTRVSLIAGRRFTVWATREAPENISETNGLWENKGQGNLSQLEASWEAFWSTYYLKMSLKAAKMENSWKSS